MSYNQTLFSHGFKIIPAENPNQLNYTYYVRAPEWRAIVFKGGGGRAWVYGKFLQVLEKNKLLHNIKEVGGSSAGALFAVLTAMPLKHKQRAEILDGLKFHRDILSNSLGSKIYRVLTYPLNLISTPFSWLSDKLAAAANKCLTLRGGFLLALPLKILSGIMQFARLITHPQLIAGLHNLITKGGIYQGRELQNYIQNTLQIGTRLSIENFLNNIKNPRHQQFIIKKLIAIEGLFSNIEKNPLTKEFRVTLSTENITFNHFHELAKIKGLGFKDVFLTATRTQNRHLGHLKIFNHINTPNAPLYLAVRMSMSAPLLYQAVKYQGVAYIDGGCAMNFPIEYASPKEYANNFERRNFSGHHGQDLDVLGVRVEYENELGILHQPVYVMTGWWEKFITRIKERIHNAICGMDIYAPDNKNINTIKSSYPLRILQLYDHGVGFTEVDIESQRKNSILKCEEERIQNFLNIHHAELVRVENYNSISNNKFCSEKNMDLKKQKQFLRFLSDKSKSNKEIFSEHFSDEDAETYRENLIKQLKVNLRGKKPL